MPEIHHLWLNRYSPNFGVQALSYGEDALISEAFQGQAEVYNYGNGIDTTHSLRLTNQRIFKYAAGTSKLVSGGFKVFIDFAEGDSFSSLYGAKRLLRICAVRQAAVRQGHTVVLGPQTIGPFESAWARGVAARSLRGVKYGFARDESSAEALADLGVKSVVLASDVAMAMPTKERLQPKSTGESTKPTVGINASGLMVAGAVGATYSANQARNYFDCLVRTGAKLQSKGFRVVILPHVAGTGKDSDWQISDALARALPETAIVQRPKDASDAKSIIATFDGFVASRFHSSVAAFSGSVPFVTLAYSPKYMRFYESLNLGTVVVPIGGAVNTAARAVSVLLEQIRDPIPLMAARALGDARLRGYVRGVQRVVEGECA